MKNWKITQDIQTTSICQTPTLTPAPSPKQLSCSAKKKKQLDVDSLLLKQLDGEEDEDELWAQSLVPSMKKIKIY